MSNLESEIEDRSRKRSSRQGGLSTTEKLLFLVAAFGFFLCVTLLVGLGVMVGHHISCTNNTTGKIQKREISKPVIEVDSDDRLRVDNIKTTPGICHKHCTTQVCQNEAHFFLRNMDKDVNPCDDFYQFACGNFIKHASIADDENKVGMITMVHKRVRNILINEAKEKIKDGELNAFKKLKTFYQNCMNKAQIEKEGVKTLLEMINSAGGWPVLGNNWKEDEYIWTKTILNYINYGYVVFPSTLYIENDTKNSSKNIITINHPQIRINPTFFLNNTGSKIIKAYYDFMVDTAVMLGANEDVATVAMKEVLDFEIDLHKMKRPLEQLIDVAATYNPMTVKEMSQRYQNIPWLEIVNAIQNATGVVINPNEIVSIRDPDFFTKVDALISRTPKRVLANYLQWNLVFDAIDYLPENFLDRKFEKLGRIYLGFKERKKKEFSCVQETLAIFPISLSALYVRKYFNKTIRESILEEVYNIKNQFRKMIEELDWMDEKTRKAALEKIIAMNVFVGYSDELFDDEKVNANYKDLEMNHGSYLQGVFNASRFIMLKKYERLKNPVDKNDWTMRINAAIVNAYYDLHKNTFEIPAGILRDSFYHFERPKYLNYGAIGSIVGHEITHGFDNIGRKFDKNGNNVEWWEESTKNEYLKKAKCIIDQYSNYTVEVVGLKLNGKLTQAENIADNSGYKAAYHAYNDWARRSIGTPEPCLPGLDYTPRQMFWISAASNWCQKQRVEDLRDSVANDLHSPPQARVLVPFSNLKEFADDFGCPVGSRMNPIHKCVVW